MTKIQGNLTNGKVFFVEKRYSESGREFEIYAGFGYIGGRIEVTLRDYDVAKVEEHGGLFEYDGPIKRDEVKYFDSVQEATNYIFRTTILTEEDFPNKYKKK